MSMENHNLCSKHFCDNFEQKTGYGTPTFFFLWKGPVLCSFSNIWLLGGSWPFPVPTHVRRRCFCNRAAPPPLPFPQPQLVCACSGEGKFGGITSGDASKPPLLPQNKSLPLSQFVWWVRRFFLVTLRKVEQGSPNDTPSPRALRAILRTVLPFSVFHQGLPPIFG